MNDPTNWNTQPDFGSFDVGDPALAKEIERRWNAYPGLLELLAGMCKNARGHDMPLTATELRAVEFLRSHGVQA